MAKLDVLFTLDYEIHGSGMGSPYDLMVEPTNRMLDQFDRYGAKLTILADVAEILKFQEYAEAQGEDRFFYGQIVEQLQRAVRNGHDVQLHMHSGYFNSVLEGGVWIQDYSEYDLANLDYDRLFELICLGKRFLEDLIRPVKSDYHCEAFRAANWSMHPSPAIVKALVENNIVIDTSVFKHGRYDDLVEFDYSGAYSDLVPWPVDSQDVCHKDPQGRLFEFPIYCEQQPIWTFLTPNRVYRVIAERLNPLPNKEQLAQTMNTRPHSLVERARGALTALAKRHPWKADFNQCSGKQLIRALERAEDKYRDLDFELPFVLIGHSKTYSRFNALSLKPFLKFVADNPHRFGFGLFRDFELEQLRDFELKTSVS